MAIITKPAVSKNTPAVFTLNRAELAAVPLVTASAYFSNVANWKYVRLFYQSSPGNQQEFVVFDGTQANPQSNFLVSAKARDVFQIQKITIEDFDKGFLEIPRSQLNVSDFDVTLTAPVAPVMFNLQIPAAGTYVAGNVLTFRANFTSTIQKPVTGSPRLVLTIGATTRYADVITTSDPSFIDFSYTIQVSDSDLDGIVVESIDLNGGAIVSPSGVPAILSFTPIVTNILINTPSNNFTVNELPGFTNIQEVIPFQQKVGASLVPILLVVGTRPAVSPFKRLYKVDASLNVTLVVTIKPTADDTITFEFNRSASVINGDGEPVIYFRARTLADQRKMFSYNSTTGITSQIADSNPTGEDLPESFFVSSVSSLDELSTNQVIYYAALNSSGLRKLFRLNTVTGNVSQVNDLLPGSNDNPSDFISFTHNSGQTYTYYLADTVPDGVQNKGLYRIDKFGAVVNIPLPTGVPVNVPGGSSVTMNFANSYTDLYVPSSTDTFSRNISSMTIFQNKLIFFGAEQGSGIGPMLGTVDKDGNTGIIMTRPFAFGSYEPDYPYPSTDSERIIYNDYLFYSQGFTGSSVRLSSLASNNFFNTFSDALNPRVLTTTLGNNFYFSAYNSTLNRSPLFEWDSAFNEGTVIGNTSTTDPSTKFLTPGSFGNSGIGLSSGGLRIVEFSGYIYFPADVRDPASIDPQASKMYRVSVGALERQEVFNANNAYEIANPGPKVTDRPMNIISGLGKVFFSAYDWDSSTVKLYYVTHT